MNPRIKFIVIFFGVSVVITGIVLLAVSFSIVDINEYGIKYSKFNKELSSEYKASGRHFIGVANTFKKFPRSLLNVEYSGKPKAEGKTLACWTKEGVNVYIELSFQYYLVPDKLKDLYLEYGDNWYSAISRLMYSRVKETTVNFTTTEFFTQRANIAGNISLAINNTFASDFQGMAYLFALQLRDIYFSKQIEEIIVQKLIASQQVKSEQAIQQATLAKLDIEIQKVISDGTIGSIYANASAYGLGITEQARAEALKTIFQVTSAAYQDLSTALGITSDVDKLQLIYVTELQNVGANKVYIGFSNTQSS